MVKKKTLYNSIINFLLKKGYKDTAKKNFQTALIKASKKTKLKCQYLLIIAFKKLSVFVEVKEVKRRGRIFKIPFFIKLQRQRYLSIKWFFKAVDENKAPIAYSEKICLELVSLIKSKNPKSLFYKEQNVKLALNNRSNIHYRW